MRPGEQKRLPNWAIGLVLVIVLAIGSFLAFTKELPFGNPFEVRAVFSSAQNVRPSSPVRIAGVNVGEVTKVEHLTSADPDYEAAVAGSPSTTPPGEAPGEQAAVVTMEIEESALPIHTDATMKLRPRLFLEGNYFVDLSPGSPNAPEIEDQFTIPVNQTAYSVQLDQVLSTLQGDVRRDLQVFLDQFGNALIKHGGAKGFRELYRTSPDAYKYTSQVNEAFLGTQPGDLQGMIKGLDSVVRAFARDEAALQDLVTNFRVFSGSFAAEDEALGRAIEELPGVLEAAEPAFANLNASFPGLRAFAREALPGVRSTPETLQVATPFIHQVRKLMSKRELRGLTADLRPTIPKLARLTRTTIPFLEESRALSSCFNEVVIPWSHDTVEPVDPANVYPHDPVGRVFEETAYGLGGIASESRSGDANGQYIRTQAGGGTNTVKIPQGQPGIGDTVGLTSHPLLGGMPSLNDSVKTQFQTEEACETQEPPNLEGGVGDISSFEQASAPASATSAAFEPDNAREEELAADLEALTAELEAEGGDNAPPEVQRELGREISKLLSPNPYRGSN